MTETASSPRYFSPNAPPSNMPPFISTPRIVSPQKQPQLQRDHHHPGTLSPNYFGFQAGEDGTFLNDAPYHAKSNWSPPSSTVRSTAAASPSVVPVDQNPDFDAFRRQSEGKAFNLGGLGNFKMNAPPPMKQNSRCTASISTPPSKDGAKTVAKPSSDPKDMTAAKSHHMPNSSLDPASAELSRSPKRVLSPGSAVQPEGVRRGSPASFSHVGSDRPASQPRFELPLDSQNGPCGYGAVKRSETLPARGDELDGQLMVTPQYVINLLGSKPEEILLLDLRVSTLYTNSHITGALSLCIPTTLLKRPSFNVQKLADTFKDEEQRSRFVHWKSSSHIVVYDASSTQLKDAQICVNTIKKFQTEGYEGTLYIIKGGFAEFSKNFSSFTVTGTRSDGRDTVDDGGPEVAPVVGGCPMPATDKPANPFFGNIRQNMDLIGGVGQIALKHPNNVSQAEEAEYPEWLRKAADDRDQGRKVSNKFEAIERREKKRMEDALSGSVSYGSPKPQDTRVKQVQIAGIEKGNKNRYNNIWPFEHTRVKLQGVPSTGCDYFNANHVKAAWSNRRYVSTQAPIPATFNDFWNVIWQQDARVIVMLTAEKEGAQVKAHNYWDSKQYGPLRLEFLSEKRASIEPARIHKHQQQKLRPGIVKRSSTRSSNPQIPLATIDAREVKEGTSQEHPYVIVRKFTLSHERRPFEPMREITQLQYSSWPDFGAPAHPAHLLGLVEQTDAVVRATSKSHAANAESAIERPVVVHCSAGCGRTGTFCTVDSVIDMLKRQRISHDTKQRQGTPMEIDEEPAFSTIGHNHKTDSKQEGAAGGGDFFSSQPRSEPVADLGSIAQDADGVWMNDDTVDLVEKTVEDFRHQRLSMVQSLRQYVLCYESVMEWLVEQKRKDEEE